MNARPSRSFGGPVEAEESPAPVLAEAKLSPPRIRASIVPRPRIREALDAGRDAALTLIAAPPGYGKTTAARDWCASRGNAVAWVTLDGGDNDPTRLWAYVATACDRLRDGLGRQALRRLADVGGSTEVAIDELMNGLATFPDELVLVLDDLHAITDAECLASLDYAIRRLPASVRMIAITRVDPALELAQLRARDDLVEVRSDDLAFDTTEAAQLLVERRGIELRAADIETLCRRTEGWPAALVLASVWLRAVEDPSGAVSEFGGEVRFVGEYLNGVALGALDDDVRGFLLRASVLGRFTCDLCDHALDRTDSAAMIDGLERSVLLVTRLERGWFRIHPLFADFARLELASADPTAEVAIHRRAKDWYLEQGMVVEALDHAFVVGADANAAELLEEHVRAIFWSGRLRTALRFLRALPDAVLAEHPDLGVSGAATTTIVGRGALERRRFLAPVRRAQQQSPERVSAYASGGVAMLDALTVDGGVAHAVEQGRRAIEVADSGAGMLSVSSRAGCAFALYFAGDLDESARLATEAIELPEAVRRPPGHALARAILAIVAVEQGRLDSARSHAEAAKSLVGGLGSSRSWLGAQAAAAVGSVHAAEGRLAEAERELAHAEQFFRDEVASVQHTWLLLMLARTRCRRGRLEQARAALLSARAGLDELGDSGRLPELLAAIEREVDEARDRAADGEVLSPPSAAELAVLRLLASDLTTREIGGELYLSANTIRSHTRALYRKLGVSTRADAVARASELGLLELPA